MMSTWQRICIGLGAAALSGAALAAEPAQRIAPPTRVPAPEPKVLRGQPVPAADLPRELRRAVVADAARRFRVAESAVVLADAEKLTWNDASLGCASPGRVYSQMRVPGFRVFAKTSEGGLQYHTDEHGQFSVCSRSSR
jgi:hypothetical protein